MIELLVVMIVLLIFAKVVWSTYKYSNTITDKLMAETDGLKVSLRFAQMLAFNDDTATWGISFPTNINYRLCKNNADASVPMIPVKGQAKDPTQPDYDPGLPNYHQVRGNVQITSMVPIINFDKWGRPLDGSGNLMTQDTKITLDVITSGQKTDTHTFAVTTNTGFIYDVSQNQ
jgi:type II secretory pathway pseudopilin PulG